MRIASASLLFGVALVALSAGDAESAPLHTVTLARQAQTASGSAPQALSHSANGLTLAASAHPVAAKASAHTTVPGLGAMTAQATVVRDFVIVGPGAGTVNASLNLRVFGTIGITYGPVPAANPAGAIVEISASGPSGVTMTGMLNPCAGACGGAPPSLTATGALASVSGTPNGATVDQTVAMAASFPVNTPFSVNFGVHVTASTVGPTASALSDFTLALPTDGPVFNLPPGYTAYAADGGVVTNGSFAVTLVPASAYNADSDVLDAALGTSGLTIEDFEDAYLVPGLGVQYTNPDASYTQLPRTFIDGSGRHHDNAWDGTRALQNHVDNVEYDGPNVTGLAHRVTFNVGSAYVFGIGLANFQPPAGIDYALIVNGVTLLDDVRTLPGFQTPLDGNGRGGYLIVRAEPGAVIESVAIAQYARGTKTPLTGNTADNLVFDHVAVGFAQDASSTLPLKNGSFEQGLGPPAPIVLLPGGSRAITGWTVIGTDIDWLSSQYLPNTYRASHGDFLLDLNGCERGGVYQDLPTVAGSEYVVRFDLAAIVSGPGPKTLRVSAAGVSQDFVATTEPVTAGWTPTEFRFVANGSSTRLQFESQAPSGCAGPLIDNVRVVAASVPADANTVAYYQFNGGQPFKNSAGNAPLSPSGNVTFPGSADGVRAAAFPATLPAADFGGGPQDFLRTTLPPITGSMSIEAFVHADTVAGSILDVIAAMGSNAHDPGQLSWGLQLRYDGYQGTSPGELVFFTYSAQTLQMHRSGFVVEPGIDYYVAAVLDVSAGTLTFYVKDLTRRGSLLTIPRQHTVTELNAVPDLYIGGFSDNSFEFAFDGLIDEVRLANTALPPNALLIAHFGRDTTAPEITAIEFDDVDQSGTVTIGDRFRFVFSEAINPSALRNGTNDANLNLSPGGGRYGNVNQIQLNGDFTEATVTITAGFTINGSETIAPSGVLADAAGNPLAHSPPLDLVDEIGPSVKLVTARYVSPVSATNDYRLTIQFDSAMDTARNPTVTFTSTAALAPTVPAGGTWLTTTYPNDTFTTANIVLTEGMDGTIRASVSGARDFAGNAMDPDPQANVFAAVVNTAPPPAPSVALGAVTCDAAPLTWNGYAAPGDLTGFQLYLATSPFSTVDGTSYERVLAAAARDTQLTGLQPGVDYYAAVVAMDTVGNIASAVSPVHVSIEMPIPAPVVPSVRGGGTATSASIDWAGYTAGCGFDRFAVYRQSASFTNVTGLTPITTLPVGSTGVRVENLDRTQVAYFAVVGSNAAGQFNPAVTSVPWTDPFAGAITTDTVLGDGDENEVQVLETMIVRNGATLEIEAGTTVRFAPGAGIVVENGKLLAEGTPFEPIVLTSQQDVVGGLPRPGDWNGVVLASGAGGSKLTEVRVTYGRGVVVSGSAPTIGELTAMHNVGPGLRVSDNGTLVTTGALLEANDVGAEANGGGNLSISGSVIKNNSLNASSDGSRPFNARGNWWGSLAPATIAAAVLGPVDTSGFLEFEPVLSPAARSADGAQVPTRDVRIDLTSRNAEEVRLGENPTFAGAFFLEIAAQLPFRLSDGAGAKTVYAQFKSATGALSAALPVAIEYVDQGPVVDAFSVAANQIIRRPLTVDVVSSSVFGIERIEVRVDGALVHAADAGDFSFRWDPRNLTAGNKTISVIARDSAGNEERVDRSIVVALEPPPAPVISSPVTGSTVAVPAVAVTGLAEPFVNVRVTRNGTPMAPATADEDGHFAVAGVTLVEGGNEIAAFAEDVIGTSPRSALVAIVLDTAPPSAPTLLEGVPRAGGQGVRLTWRKPDAGETPTSYDVYRAASPFASPAEATRVAHDVAATSTVDQTVADGTYHYAVVAVDAAGTPSVLSNQLVVVYDATPPAFSISYATPSPAGVGTLGVTLTVSEPLVLAPSLVFTPAGGTPSAVPLTRLTPTTYGGEFEIAADTPSGEVQVKVSGRDLAGNFTNGGPTGPQLAFDTDGPAGVVTTMPLGPVQIQSPTTVQVALALSEPVRAGTQPLLRFAPPTGPPIDVPLTGGGTAWGGTLNLGPGLGTGVGTFDLTAEDALGNIGKMLTGGARLEIYDAAAPTPADPPAGLQATSLPGGAVALGWSAADLAQTYRIFRAPGDCSAPPTVAIQAGVAGTSFVDTPPADGAYCYGVASERAGAVSGLDTFATAVADRVPPGAPVNVAAQLVGTGVRVTWSAPAGEAPAAYTVLQNGVTVTTVAGSALAAEVLPDLGGSYDYVVLAKDGAGNAEPSATASINLLVGAVKDLVALVADGQAPILTWTSSDPAVVGYKVYRNDVLLTQTALTAAQFADTRLAGVGSVAYKITALNAANVESPARSLSVQPLAISITTNPDASGVAQPLVAGYLNTVAIDYALGGGASSPLTIDALDLTVTANGQPRHARHVAAAVTLPPGESETMSLVLPLHDEITGQLINVTIADTQAGGTTRYQHATLAEGLSRSPVAIELVAHGVPLAGGVAAITQCVFNHGTVPMDIVVRRNGGASPGDVQLRLLNDEGLEVAFAAFNGLVSGARIGNGFDYVRIEPGREQCFDLSILVPAGLDTGVGLRFVGAVSSFGYDLEGTPLLSDAILSGEIRSGVVKAAYSGTADADKDSYSNDETIVISGQAIDETTQLPVANADLNVGFFVNGFRWFEGVTTDGNGLYSLEYEMSPALAGDFTVWAAHPDVFDTLEQDRFTIRRLFAAPSDGEIRSAKGEALSFNIDILNPGEQTLTGFALEFRAYTVNGSLDEIPEPRVHGTLVVPAGFELSPKERKQIELTLAADLNAPDAAIAEYRIVSAEGAVSLFQAAVTLQAPIPVVEVVTPAAGFVETSLDRGQERVVPVTVQNNGLEVLEDAVLTVPQDVAWMSTNLPLQPNGTVLLGDIGVGESRTFDVVLSPPLAEPFGNQLDRFTVRGSNHASALDIFVSATVTSELTGGIAFQVSNNIGQRVVGARVRLVNRAINDEVAGGDTDASGETALNGLQEGTWQWQVSAPGHATATGTIDVLPGLQVVEPVELSRNLVTVNFRVEPIPFTDTYHIVVEQTFFTNVPAPVFVLEPPVVDLGLVKAGDEFTLNAKARNTGLIKIFNIDVEGSRGGGLTVTPLTNFVPELRPGEMIQLPFLVRVEAVQGGLPGILEFTSLACGLPGGLGDTVNGIANLVGLAKSQLRNNINGTTQAALNILGGTGKDLKDPSLAMCGLAPYGNTNGTGPIMYGPGGWVDYDGRRYLNPGDWTPGSTTSNRTGGGLTQCISTLACIGAGQFAAASALDVRSNRDGGGGGGRVPTPVSSTATNAGFGGVGCFAAGTPVRGGDGGLVAIDELSIGDLVDTPEGPRRVERVYRIESDHIRELRLSVRADGVRHADPTREQRLLRTTDEHLFWVLGRGWIAAHGLAIGDLIALEGEGTAELVETLRLDTPQTVYNLDVEKAHSFFANGALVYQKCGAHLEALEDEATARIRALIEGESDEAPVEAGGFCPVDTAEPGAAVAELCR
jgi:choice-of-anchor C domain-containing protein